jgi:hypothetical protein
MIEVPTPIENHGDEQQYLCAALHGGLDPNKISGVGTIF